MYMDHLIYYNNCSSVGIQPNLAPNTYGTMNGTTTGLVASTDIVRGVGGGKATEYDGSEYTTLGTDAGLPSGTADRSFVFFAKVASFNAGRIFSYGQWSANNAFDIIAQTGEEFMVVSHTNNYTTTKSDFATGRWYCIGIILESQNLTIYYDESTDSTQATTIDTTLISTARLGYGITGRASYYSGCIDTFGAFDIALTKAQYLDYRKRALNGNI